VTPLLSVGPNCLEKKRILSIGSLQMGHIFLRYPWRNCGLVLAVSAVALNCGQRIVTIAGFTLDANAGCLDALGVHGCGGITFFSSSLSVLTLFVALLRPEDRFAQQGRDR
jgi:hypothetical protein